MTSPAQGEELTVALLDSIAIHWLLSIDRRLINIVKTEFSTELKTKRLSEMIKPIATNIDDLLARYEKKDQVVTIKSGDTNPSTFRAESNIQDQGTAIDTIVRRLEKLKTKSRRPKSRFRLKNNYTSRKSQCKHCQFLNNQLGSALDINHSSDACKKRKLPSSAQVSASAGLSWSLILICPTHPPPPPPHPDKYR